jgi:hypothetical protein
MTPTTGDRLIIVHNELYGRLDKFCKDRNIFLLDWVEEALKVSMETYREAETEKKASILQLVVPESKP